MRWQVVAHATGGTNVFISVWLPERSDFSNQAVYLLLLADYDCVQLLQQVFGKAGLDFQIGQALINIACVLRVVQVFHARIGPEFSRVFTGGQAIGDHYTQVFLK